MAGFRIARSWRRSRAREGMCVDSTLDEKAPPLTQARITVRLNDGRVLTAAANGARRLSRAAGRRRRAGGEVSVVCRSCVAAGRRRARARADPRDRVVSRRENDDGDSMAMRWRRAAGVVIASGGRAERCAARGMEQLQFRDWKASALAEAMKLKPRAACATLVRA